MRINENILISSLTTMRLGGPARYVYEIEKPEEIPDAYGFAKTYNLPVFVLGGGANTIGHDEGFNGVIIINRMRGITDVTWMGDDSGRGPQNVLQSKNFGEGEGLSGPARRIIAVGTTVARTLEYYAKTGKTSGEDDIFIYPGFEFQLVDALLTNFHAPKSTVLMLASAFAGWDNLKHAYDHAIEQKYNFLSYGDSMLIC